MGIIRTSLLLFVTTTLTLTSQAISGEIQWTESRRELKEMTVKNHNPLTSYSYARRVVMQQIHLKRDSNGYYIEDVYCHETFRHDVGPNRMPDHTRVNIEHTWPQSRFSSRANRRIQKADLHHLYPSESNSNSTRGNYTFSEVENNYNGSLCSDSSVGNDPRSGHTSFEPPTDHKGNVARALFYFSVRYDIDIPDYEEFYLRMWNYQDPVDEDERRRNDVVESVQGNRNPFIDDPSLADLILNF